MNAEDQARLRSLDRQFEAVRRLVDPIPPRERYRARIESLRAGGFLRVRGKTFCVQIVHEYREKRSKWFELELFCIDDGATVMLEWEKDDEVELSLSGPRIDLRALRVTPDEVEAMSEAEEGRIRFEGRTYHYDDDYKATFHRDGAGDGERVYFYDFETSDERYCLSVEEWGSAEDGYEYEAYVSEYLEEDALEILRLGAADDV